MLLLLNTPLAGPSGVQAYVHAFKEYVNNEQRLEVTELQCAAASLTPAAAAAAADGGDEVALGTGFKVLDAVVRNDFMEIIPVTLSPCTCTSSGSQQQGNGPEAMDMDGAQVSHLAANCTTVGNHGTCLLLPLLQQGICHMCVCVCVCVLLYAIPVAGGCEWEGSSAPATRSSRTRCGSPPTGRCCG